MEQRIGRLDRIGRDRPVTSTIFIGPQCQDSLYESWYRVLNDGFRVFDASIASLQFFVDENVPQLLAAMFKRGAQGLIDEVEAVREGVIRERERIGEQDALDAIDALDQDSLPLRSRPYRI